MTRGMALVIGLLALAAALFAAYAVPRAQTYFDPALTRDAYPCSWPEAKGEAAKPLDPSFEGWFSQPLHDAGEPSLFRNKPPSGSTTIRFTFVPAFVDPIVVRIDDLHGSAPTLTAYRVVGQVRPEPDRNLRRALSVEEVKPLRDFITTSGVLEEPPNSCLVVPDASIYLIEASGPDGYRFINRISYDDDPVYQLGNLMFALTGWPNGPQGPDLDHLPPYYGPVRAYP